jgi:antitoxin MazE
MVTKVQKWGNSQGLRFTKAILEEAKIEVGDEVEVVVRRGRIIVKPISKVRGKHDDKLVNHFFGGQRSTAVNGDLVRDVAKVVIRRFCAISDWH